MPFSVYISLVDAALISGIGGFFSPSSCGLSKIFVNNPDVKRGYETARLESR